ncbi:MAG TPA: S-adenosylmethionine:tRNA ribosyltransferase-isomerase [Cytophagales bacterium]|jgi:S-adenosylmethionine:tRNA ribosyltransferase-isomerase
MPEAPLPIAQQTIRLEAYTYDLPDDRIATVPLDPRDHSKLLVYRRGAIEHHVFKDLAAYVPAGSLLVFNDTKVIPARLYFRRDTGALVEIFLLQPHRLEQSIHAIMGARAHCTWRCLIGNKKRWKEGEALTQELATPAGAVTVRAVLADREAQEVRFEWTPADLRFAELLPHLGEIPLPPYLNRKATERDKTQYQTVYAKKEGAVAAPTAGLHFTDRVLASLAESGAALDYITLHVGAGTFQPIKAENVIAHPMHAEQIVFSRRNLEQLAAHAGRIIAVGTTSMRALESLYWYGVKLLKGQAGPHLFVEKLYPYGHDPAALPPAGEVFGAVARYMAGAGMEELIGETEILIVPDYPFRVCRGLVTNYHQPGSTLILLVAAFVGDDWRRIYGEALAGGYRFLSYGDSSLLLP